MDFGQYAEPTRASASPSLRLRPSRREGEVAWALLLLLFCCCLTPNTHAQIFGSKPTNATSEPIESAKQALRSTAPPWYDAEKDGVRSLQVEAEAEPETRGEWNPEMPQWRTNWKWNWGGPSFSWFGEILRFLGWTLLIGLLAVLIYALVRAFMNVDPAISGLTGKAQEVDVRADLERIENLPVPIKQARKGNFLDMARQFYQEGNFADAIVYLFSHRLLQLDRAGRIRLTKGKTNRQYLREINSSKELQRILGSTIVSFEEVFFGKHALSKDQFERCWNHNDSFEQLLQQQATA